MVKKEKQRLYSGAEHFSAHLREDRDWAELEAAFRQLCAEPKDVPIHKHIWAWTAQLLYAGLQMKNHHYVMPLLMGKCNSLYMNGNA